MPFAKSESVRTEKGVNSEKLIILYNSAGDFSTPGLAVCTMFYAGVVNAKFDWGPVTTTIQVLLVVITIVSFRYRRKFICEKYRNGEFKFFDGVGGTVIYSGNGHDLEYVRGEDPGDMKGRLQLGIRKSNGVTKEEWVTNVDDGILVYTRMIAEFLDVEYDPDESSRWI